MDRNKKDIKHKIRCRFDRDGKVYASFGLEIIFR